LTPLGVNKAEPSALVVQMLIGELMVEGVTTTFGTGLGLSQFVRLNKAKTVINFAVIL
jgi:hypothetical protein